MVHSDQKAILKKLLNFDASGNEEKLVAPNALILSKISGQLILQRHHPVA